MLGMGFPTSIVYGQVLPGAAVAVMAGNFYYAWSAARLAKEKKTPQRCHRALLRHLHTGHVCVSIRRNCRRQAVNR